MPPAPSLPLSIEQIFTLCGSEGNISFASFRPDFEREVPPMLETLPGELKWINPHDTPTLLWDEAMCADSSGRGQEVRNVFAYTHTHISSAYP